MNDLASPATNRLLATAWLLLVCGFIAQFGWLLASISVAHFPELPEVGITWLLWLLSPYIFGAVFLITRRSSTRFLVSYRLTLWLNLGLVVIFDDLAYTMSPVIPGVVVPLLQLLLLVVALLGLRKSAAADSHATNRLLATTWLLFGAELIAQFGWMFNPFSDAFFFSSKAPITLYLWTWSAYIFGALFLITRRSSTRFLISYRRALWVNVVLVVIFDVLTHQRSVFTAVPAFVVVPPAQLLLLIVAMLNSWKSQEDDSQLREKREPHF